MIIRSSCLLLPPGHDLEARIRETAEIVNPAYLDHERMVSSGVRSRMASKPPRYIQVWRLIPGGHRWAGGTLVPRCWAPGVLARLVERDAFDHYADQPLPSPAFFADGFAPRDYQCDAVGAVQEGECGVVVMPCGAGKTSTGVAVIERLQQRTLILVHTKDLARQWVERIQGTEEMPGQLVGVTVGTVGGGRKSTDEGADVVVATVQTLATWSWRDLLRWGRGFGLVIMDEAHHAPAETFLAVLNGLPARYRVGLTATPEREDGMGDLLWAAFGEVLFEVPRAELVSRGAIRPARLVTHHTGAVVATHEYRQGPRSPWIALTPGTDDFEHARRAVRGAKASGDSYPRMRPRRYDAQVTALITDPDRNEVIIDLASMKVHEGHSVIILSERVAHCQLLAKTLRERGIPAAAVAGKQTQREVSAILSSARRGETRVLVGTTKADEGLDVPVLSCGILATRTKKFGRLTQRIGRIERPDGMAPEWHDLVDAYPSAVKAGKERMKLYERLGLEGATWRKRRKKTSAA